LNSFLFFFLVLRAALCMHLIPKTTIIPTYHFTVRNGYHLQLKPLRCFSRCLHASNGLCFLDSRQLATMWGELARPNACKVVHKTDPGPNDSKRTRYKVEDHLLRFWFLLMLSTYLILRALLANNQWSCQKLSDV